MDTQWSEPRITLDRVNDFSLGVFQVGLQAIATAVKAGIKALNPTRMAKAKSVCNELAPKLGQFKFGGQCSQIAAKFAGKPTTGVATLIPAGPGIGSTLVAMADGGTMEAGKSLLNGGKGGGGGSLGVKAAFG